MTKRRIRTVLYLLFPALCLCINTSFAQLNTSGLTPSKTFNLPVISIVNRPAAYANFCRRSPLECSLNGNVSAIIKLTPEVLALLNQVNQQVNDEIIFALDIDQYNREEYWALPASGFGDCEDIALEKRSRLLKHGFPISAMRITIVSHKQSLYSHAILSIETDKGSYVMNSFSDKISPWQQAPYNYESRERADGLWERYDQSFWTFDPVNSPY